MFEWLVEFRVERPNVDVDVSMTVCADTEEEAVEFAEWELYDLTEHVSLPKIIDMNVEKVGA